ncbi:MAG TPA: hypothetical protein VHF50_01540 [Solirubrobacterales bacterium]|nr:hypothetical protein [Solirubrobacterales bacterium]
MDGSASWRTDARDEQLDRAAQLFTQDVTAPGASFLSSHLELIGFLGFVGRLTEHVDGVINWLDEQRGVNDETTQKDLFRRN